ncbi:MAG: PAS domain S-box protein [Planctomycetes bacterium]|nr:PAS domain S-box protein [Planctomycetota bacterium]
MFQFRSISTKFILFVSLLVLLSVGVFVGVIVELGKQSRSSVKKTNEALTAEALRKEWEEKGRAMASLLAIQFVQPMYELDVSKMQSLAGSTLKERCFNYVYVLDTKGLVLVDAAEGSALMGRVLTDEVTKKALVAKDVIVQRHSDMVDIAAPVVAGTKRLGTVRIGFSTEGIRKTTATITGKIGDDIDRAFVVTMKKVLFLLPLIVLPAVVIGWLFVRGLMSPIRDLVLGMEKIAKGDLTYQVRSDSEDEIGRLASSFNKMAGELQRITVSRNYVDNIIKSMLDMLIVVEPDGTIKTVNPAVCNLLGYEEEEIVGRQVATIFAEEEQVRMGQVFGNLVRQGSIHDVDTSLVSSSGRKVSVIFAGSVTCSSGGEIEGIICVATNITERKRAEERLRESEEKYRRLIGTANDAIILEDAETGIILEVNKRAEEMIGLPAEQIVGMHLTQIHPADEAERYKKGFEDVVRKGRKTSTEDLFVSHKDGLKIPVEISSSVIDLSGKKVVQATFRDITERKQAERELKKTMEELGRSNAELEQFAHVASHDLKEPLVVILGYLQQIKRHSKGTLEENIEGFVDRAMEGTTRMENLINDLLMYSRVGGGGEELKPTDCSDIIEWVLGNLKTTVEESGAEVTHDKLPTVLANPDQLVQLFQNLIGNAIKFHGDEPPKVHISAAAKDGEWQFSVRDNGIGISSKDIDHVFEIFKRMHDKKVYPGTGIGLSICKKIVEHHGGRIWVESEPGKGSTFHFTVTQQT